MGNNDELKEFSIKNATGYCFDDITSIADFFFYKSNEDSYENILIYNISDKHFMGAKTLYIRFNKVAGFIKIYDGTRYLVLFGIARYNAIYDRIRKSSITYSLNHNFANTRIDSYYYLPTEKKLSYHNVTILIKCVFNKNKNYYHYKRFV